MGAERRVVAAVLGGALLLFAEIRFEHREVLGETWAAWLPLVYAALLVAVGGVALWRFDRGGRGVLRLLFAAAILLGCLGLWFHSGGHLLRSALQILSAFGLERGEGRRHQDRQWPAAARAGRVLRARGHRAHRLSGSGSPV